MSGNPDIKDLGVKFAPGVGAIINKFGMDDEEFEKYKQDIIEEYQSNPYISLKIISEREQSKGRDLYVSRIAGWLKRRNIPIHDSREIVTSKDRGDFRLAIDVALLESLDPFKSKSETVRVILRIALGIPEPSIILKLGDGINLICIFDRGRRTFSPYLTDEITPFEQQILQHLIQEANEQQSGSVITDFAYRNELSYLGGTPFEEILSAH